MSTPAAGSAAYSQEKRFPSTVMLINIFMAFVLSELFNILILYPDNTFHASVLIFPMWKLQFKKDQMTGSYTHVSPG